MAEPRSDLIGQVASLADEVGPALVPVGHVELLRSITAAAKELFGAAACSVALLDPGGLKWHITWRREREPTRSRG